MDSVVNGVSGLTDGGGAGWDEENEEETVLDEEDGSLTRSMSRGATPTPTATATSTPRPIAITPVLAPPAEPRCSVVGVPSFRDAVGFVCGSAIRHKDGCVGARPLNTPRFSALRARARRIIGGIALKVKRSTTSARRLLRSFFVSWKRADAVIPFRFV